MRHSLIALTCLLLTASAAAFGQDTKLYVVTHVDLTPNYTADGTPLGGPLDERLHSNLQ